MISVIIPTLNEQKALPATLQSLLPQISEHEVIICDGGSSDQTVAIAEFYKQQCPKLTVCKAKTGRALQMNAGAYLAEGEWLLFLHADSLLPIDGLAAIASQRAKAGVFTHKFSGDHWGLKLISQLHNKRFRSQKIMYGDQGIFVRADLFKTLGGYPDTLMEDIRFSEQLLTETVPIQLTQVLLTDSRKFVQIGVWRALWWVLIILLKDRGKKNDTVAKPDFFANYR